MQTLDQKLLKWAHESVNQLQKQGDLSKKYKTAVNSAPSFIQGCGLAQAVAFWSQKAHSDGQPPNEEEKAYSHLMSQLNKALSPVGTLQDSIMNDDLEAYMLMTDRVQRALVFLKRVTLSYYEGDENP